MRTAVLLPLCLALAAAAPGASVPVLEIEAPEALAPIEARVRAFDRERLRTAMRLVGLDDPGPPIRVRLVPERSVVARRTPDWVAGYAQPADDLVVLFPARSPTYPDDTLEDVLHHEVAHVLVARAAGGRPVPRWFNEGLAMAAEPVRLFGDRARLALELAGSRPQSMAEVDRLFAGEQRAASRAYALSGAFVRHLLETHGQDLGARILARIARGERFPDAFHAAAGVTLPQAERAFWERQTFWTRWVPFLTSSAALWMAVTLLVLYAIRRRRARREALRRKWEAEGLGD